VQENILGEQKTMNRKSLLFTLPLIAMVLMSCQFGSVNVNLNREMIDPSGTLKTETREISGVERVSLQDFGDLTILQGDSESLSIEADDNLLPYLQTEVNGQELVLKIKDGYEFTNEATIHYTLKVKNLNRVSVAGAGNVTAEKLSVGDMALNIAGSGNIKIADLQAANLRSDASGTGNFDLKGKVASQALTINGAGNYACGDLQSDEGTVTINGAGNVTVWVVNKLDITVNGFGNVNYYGSPRVSQNITGGGGVKDLGAHE